MVAFSDGKPVSTFPENALEHQGRERFQIRWDLRPLGYSCIVSNEKPDAAPDQVEGSHFPEYALAWQPPPRCHGDFEKDDRPKSHAGDHCWRDDFRCLPATRSCRRPPGAGEARSPDRGPQGPDGGA